MRSAASSSTECVLQTSRPHGRTPRAGLLPSDQVWKAGLVAIGALCVCLRAYRMAYFALWNDEVFTVNAARMPWNGMLHTVLADVVHPPLFYILLKVWIGIGGTSISWMRLLPLLLSSVAVVPFYLLCRELEIPRAAVSIGFVLFAFNTLLIHYAQEVRMYSPLLLFSLTSLWLFVRFTYKGKGFVVLGITNLILIYTHYYGVLFVVTEAIILTAIAIQRGEEAERQKTRRFLTSCVILALLFMPWLYGVTRAAFAKHGVAENFRAISVPAGNGVAWFYQTLNGSLPVRHAVLLGLLLFLAPVVIALARQSARREQLLILGFFAFFPTAVAFTASHLLPYSVFGQRYLITAVVPYLLLVATSIFSISALSLRRALAVIFIAWSIGAGILFVRQPDRKVRWDLLAQEIRRQGVPVYTYEQHEHRPIQFYGVNSTMLTSQEEVSAVHNPDFVIVYRNTSWRGPVRPEVLFERNGFQLVNSFRAQTPSETIIASHLRLAR
jgi:4-amino-4-deoxy-L-arabinose transferase-like glycosyltransferase